MTSTVTPFPVVDVELGGVRAWPPGSGTDLASAAVPTPVARRVASVDSTALLLADGYRFIGAESRRQGGVDVFATRIAGRRVTCMTGPDAAREFGVAGRFTRRQALPPTVLRLLQNTGSVATLDGDAHAHRKEIFRILVGPDRFDLLLAHVRAEWDAAIVRWSGRSSVRLHDAVTEVLTRAVCSWLAVPLPEADAAIRADQIAAMIDGAGALGPRVAKGYVQRRRCESWLATVVDGVRSGRLDPPPGSGLHVIATHRDLQGRLLDRSACVTELLNLIRPTVAVARFVVFVALALHQQPWEAEAVRNGGRAERNHFVQEVRRLTPFFPMVAGRVVEPFAWNDHHFERDDWVLLDIYGTNRDSRIFDDPDRFRPHRFAGSAIAAAPTQSDELIPQGSGTHWDGHRCPGEWITIALMDLALGKLVSAMTYSVGDQDLSVSMRRFPTLPASGVVLTDVVPTP
jgi:fatty-acid peroxygenase